MLWLSIHLRHHIIIINKLLFRDPYAHAYDDQCDKRRRRHHHHHHHYYYDDDDDYQHQAIGLHSRTTYQQVHDCFSATDSFLTCY